MSADLSRRTASRRVTSASAGNAAMPSPRISSFPVSVAGALACRSPPLRVIDDLIVGHQPGNAKDPVRSRMPRLVDKAQGQVRLAGSGQSKKQHPFAIHGDTGRRGACVESAIGRHPILRNGRQADDEARPEDGRSPVASALPRRFSAQMRPLWASTICFEIDRPRPEFLPKLTSGRSV